MRFLILIISVFFIGLKLNGVELSKTKPSVLIIGSSIPALTAALHLTDQNIPITIFYPTPCIDNPISPTDSLVQNIHYRLPKHHPIIFQNSALFRDLATRFGNTFSQLHEINLLVDKDEILSISENEYIATLISSAWKHKCLDLSDIMNIRKVIKAIENYDPNKDKYTYSNMTFLEFANRNNAPPKFISCLLKSSLIDLGIEIHKINAADAISRMQFYYVKSKNGLRSYHMINQYASINNSKLLVDQICNQLKLKNTTFKSNYSIEAFGIDKSSATISGDINNQNLKYDFVIIADTLQETRRILSTTKAYNSGVPKIYDPLKQILNSLNQYSNATNILSIKIWLSKPINADRKPVIEINNSPHPFSLQSIRQIDKLCGNDNLGNILEIIVADFNSTAKIDWIKITNELKSIFPELSNASIYQLRYDIIDLGVLMDTKYGMNRLNVSSMINMGIKNLVLAGDWLEAPDNLANGLEKSVMIGQQAAMEIITRISF